MHLVLVLAVCLLRSKVMVCEEAVPASHGVTRLHQEVPVQRQKLHSDHS